MLFDAFCALELCLLRGGHLVCTKLQQRLKHVWLQGYVLCAPLSFANGSGKTLGELVEPQKWQFDVPSFFVFKFPCENCGQVVMVTM